MVKSMGWSKKLGEPRNSMVNIMIFSSINFPSSCLFWIWSHQIVSSWCWLFKNPTSLGMTHRFYDDKHRYTTWFWRHDFSQAHIYITPVMMVDDFVKTLGIFLCERMFVYISFILHNQNRGKDQIKKTPGAWLCCQTSGVGSAGGQCQSKVSIHGTQRCFPTGGCALAIRPGIYT